MGKKRQLDGYHTRAFTLLESIVALFIVSLSSVLLISSISSIQTVLTHHTQHALLDVYRFFSYFENHLSSELVQRADSDMIVTRDGDKHIYYELYQNLIRRRGEKGGHEPLLSGVKQWRIERLEHIIAVHVWLENGDIYEKHIFITADKKE